MSISGNFTTTSAEVRNLGVILDSTLSFDSHIKNITKTPFFNLKNISKLKPPFTHLQQKQFNRLQSKTLLQGHSPAPGPGIKSLPSFNSCIGSLSTTAFNTKSFYQTYLPLNSKPTPFVSQLSVFLESSHPGFAPWVTGLSVWQSPNSGMPCRL
jgi:hypothetical protein